MILCLGRFLINDLLSIFANLAMSANHKLFKIFYLLFEISPISMVAYNTNLVFNIFIFNRYALVIKKIC